MINVSKKLDALSWLDKQYQTKGQRVRINIALTSPLGTIHKKQKIRTPGVFPRIYFRGGQTELEITAGHWPFSLTAEQKCHMIVSKSTNGQNLHIGQPKWTNFTHWPTKMDKFYTLANQNGPNFYILVDQNGHFLHNDQPKWLKFLLTGQPNGQNL